MEVDVSYSAVANNTNVSSDEILSLLDETGRLVMPLVEKMALPKSIVLRKTGFFVGRFFNSQNLKDLRKAL